LKWQAQAGAWHCSSLEFRLQAASATPVIGRLKAEPQTFARPGRAASSSASKQAAKEPKSKKNEK